MRLLDRLSSLPERIMAQIPTPRSFNQVLGRHDRRLRLALRPQEAEEAGNPVLSILEAAAQSDVRASQDIFDLLNSASLGALQGPRAGPGIGADADLVRITESPRKRAW
jgi:hypothetical protein